MRDPSLFRNQLCNRLLVRVPVQFGNEHINTYVPGINFFGLPFGPTKMLKHAVGSALRSLDELYALVLLMPHYALDTLVIRHKFSMDAGIMFGGNEEVQRGAFLLIAFKHVADPLR